MTKLQWGVVGGAVVVFLALYFGFDTKPPGQKKIEQSRALVTESTDINTLIREAKTGLPTEKSGAILNFETMLESAEADSLKINALQQLAGAWYRFERPDISGYYAEELANLAATEESWSIAGTTYTICTQRMNDQKVKDFCSGRAIRAFENAISINPSNVQHQVNLALCYAENPPADNPMKGVLMLRDLNEKNPDNPLILKSLGRLAIKTSQFDRAKERLEKALTLQPNDPDIICLLAQTYSGLKDAAKAVEFQAKCDQFAEQEN